MKCPNCQAELLPVDGEMFCLQCGRVAHLQPGDDGHGPPLENTTDPVLQRAIQEVSDHQVKFLGSVAPSKPPVLKAAAASVKSFGSLHNLSARQRPVLATAGGATIGLPVAVASKPSLAVKAASVVPPAPIEKLVNKPLPTAAESPVRPGLGLASPGVALAVAALAFVVVINIVVAVAFNGRVYPGVRIGQLSVGGMTDAQMGSELSHTLKPLALTATVGGAVYTMQAPGLGQVDTAAVEQRAREIGRSTLVPLVGLVQAWFSRPVPVTYAGNSAEIGQAVAQLAAQADHVSTDALPLVVNGQAFVISEKAGDSLDVAKTEVAVRGALAGSGAQIAAPVSSVMPVVTAVNYLNDVAAAQARMSLSIKLSVKSAIYSPTAAQIGGWLVYGGPGKGVTADPAQVAAYVAGIPGRFDRNATVAALLGALNSGQALNYAASTRRVTVVPQSASLAPAWPQRTLSYCLMTDSGNATAAESLQAATVLNDPKGWALGGRLKFIAVKSGCNFTIRLVSASNMAALDPACARQTTCNVGNQIEINASSWATAPAGWSGGLAAYDNELINHETGHWLGFTHASCTGQGSPAPILQAPTLVLGGCSPNWYEVAANVAGTKVLPGF